MLDLLYLGRRKSNLDDVKIPVSRESLEEFCRRWKIAEFSLFGSALREDFRPDSDVDISVSFT